MGGKSRYVWAVWALLIGFSLFCGGWFLFQARISGPYRVTTARYPPRVGPSGVQSAPTDSSVLAHHSHPDSLLPGETIDLNTADWYDLQRLPGIGEKRAMDIAAWREEHGPFRNVEELTQVAGIGPAILENLREYVTTGNE